MAGDPKDTGGQAPAADAEADRVKSLDSRFEKIETEQTRQGGLLQTIADKLGGTEKTAHAAAQQRTEERLEHGSIAAQVAKAVRDVGAEQAAEAQRKAHDAEHERLRKGREEQGENQPRPQQPTWKQRFQSGMFGKDPS